MKVDYLFIHFKTSMIPSRTKHESFDSFGSHAQLLRLITSGEFRYLFLKVIKPILFSLFIFQKKIETDH